MRSSWKHPIINLRRDGTKIWKSQHMITENGKKYLLIYNGHTFKKLNVTREKVGYRVGEFRFTRTKNMKRQEKTRKR